VEHDSRSFFLELAIVVIGSLLGLGTNFAAIVSNRRHAKLLKRESEAAIEKRKTERGFRRLVISHERKFQFLKGKGTLSGYYDEANGGADADWDL
jgi:hypothetical protein